MRKKVDVLSDALEHAAKAGAVELCAELEEMITQEIAIEAAITGKTTPDPIPVFLVTLSQDVTVVPPMGGEANHFTRAKPAVVIVRPDPKQLIKGLSDDVQPEDLLPRDDGLRVYGNWKIIEVIDGDAQLDDEAIPA